MSFMTVQPLVYVKHQHRLHQASEASCCRKSITSCPTVCDESCCISPLYELLPPLLCQFLEPPPLSYMSCGCCKVPQHPPAQRNLGKRVCCSLPRALCFTRPQLLLQLHVSNTYASQQQWHFNQRPCLCHFTTALPALSFTSASSIVGHAQVGPTCACA